MKKPLLILHGAIGSSEQFKGLKTLLEKRMDVYTLDFPGHGKTTMPEEDFSIDLFARHTVEWMDKNKLDKVDIFGYSMGGFVGVYLASHFKERVNRVFTLATKFNWSKEIAAREVKLLDPEVIKEKLPEFAETLEKRHSINNWEDVLQKTATMLNNMGRKNPLDDDDLKSIEQPVRIGMGDRDNMVIIEESVYSYRLLRNGQLLILPNTPHPIEKVPVKRLQRELQDFFD